MQLMKLSPYLYSSIQRNTMDTLLDFNREQMVSSTEISKSFGKFLERVQVGQKPFFAAKKQPVTRCFTVNQEVRANGKECWSGAC
jgi:hypothetical protein